MCLKQIRQVHSVSLPDVNWKPSLFLAFLSTPKKEREIEREIDKRKK